MTETDAMQAALAGEHAAMYGIGVAGGRLRGSQFQAATTAYAEHRTRRDRLTQFLLDLGQEPVPAAPAYDLPKPVTTTTAAVSLILVIERRLASVYGDLVEAAEADPVRAFGVQALLATARAQLRWGGTPSAFPGTP